MRVNFFSQSGGQNSGLQPSLSATITGPLILAGNPNGPLEAAPKQYVDSTVNSLNASNIKSGVVNPARLPAFTGDATSATGSGSFILSNTGVVPGTYTKVTVDSKGRVLAGSQLALADIPPFSWSKITSGKPTTVDGYGITDVIKVSGSTVSGTLSLNVDPTSALHAATKQYVDNLAGSGTALSTGTITRRPTSTTPSGFLRCNGARLSKTTYSALYAAIGAPYTVSANLNYTSYAAMGGGKPWRMQYEYNVAQNTDITGWTTAPNSLPTAFAYAQALVTKNRVYLIGGYNTSTGYLSSVFTAAINADGTLGAWSSNTGLPAALGTGHLFATENRVYLLGGNNGTAYNGNVYSAPINADGTLGTWVAGTALPGTLGGGQVVVTFNRVYLIGGYNGSTVVGTVYTAPINSDGTIGAWTTGTSLPGALNGASTIVTKNRVYILSGYDSTNAAVSTVYTAPINSDGTLGAWTTATSLPAPLAQSSSVVVNNTAYLIGGSTTGNTVTNTVYMAPINPDGTLGAWVTSVSLPGNFTASQAIVTSSKVYLLGGSNGAYQSTVYMAAFAGGANDYSALINGTINTFNGTVLTGKYTVTDNYDNNVSQTQQGSGQPWLQHYTINTQQSNDFASFVGTSALPQPVQSPMTFITKNRVYLIGGYNGNSYYNNIFTATISNTGVIGSWTAAGTFPITVYGAYVVMTKNRVYIMGGTNGAGGTYTSIYTAVINADGTIGAFSSAGTIPAGGYNGFAFVTKGRLCIASGTFSFNTYSAPINTDGTLGAWVTDATSMIYRTSGTAGIVTHNRVYLFGGYNSDGSSVNSFIQTAPINADGTLGTWSVAATPLPTTLANLCAYASANRVWVIGGSNGSGTMSTAIYSAPLYSDGTIGPWTTSNSTGIGSYCSTLVATSGYLYVLGGGTGNGSTTMSNMAFAVLAGGLNDYSPYYDGTITPVDAGLFVLPDFSGVEDGSEYYFVKT